jgi:hypothetical protein
MLRRKTISGAPGFVKREIHKTVMNLCRIFPGGLQQENTAFSWTPEGCGGGAGHRRTLDLRERANCRWHRNRTLATGMHTTSHRYRTLWWIPKNPGSPAVAPGMFAAGSSIS